MTSMLVGFAWGKRYTSMQIFSVAMLTAGIITAAMADAKSKVKTPATNPRPRTFHVRSSRSHTFQGKTSASTTKIDHSFITGLIVLAIAQLLSAVMGLYTQLTYAAYGSHWHENLFYSHFLSLPLFLPFFPSLRSEFTRLLSSAPISIFPSTNLITPSFATHANTTLAVGPIILTTSSWPSITIPKQTINLAANALTQYICIRGVNLLSARTSALGVTIALNVRKLISLFLSIWLFGNRLPEGVLLGAAIVFGSAGVWAVEGQRLNNNHRGAAAAAGIRSPGVEK